MTSALAADNTPKPNDTNQTLVRGINEQSFATYDANAKSVEEVKQLSVGKTPKVQRNHSEAQSQLSV